MCLKILFALVFGVVLRNFFNSHFYFKLESKIHQQLMTCIVYQCTCHKAVHTDIHLIKPQGQVSTRTNQSRGGFNSGVIRKQLTKFQIHYSLHIHMCTYTCALPHHLEFQPRDIITHEYKMKLDYKKGSNTSALNKAPTYMHEHTYISSNAYKSRPTWKHKPVQQEIYTKTSVSRLQTQRHLKTNSS